MISMLLKSLVVFVVIAIAEMLHGIWRVRVLNPRWGDRRARQLGLISGCVLILVIAWVAMPWLAPSGAIDCLAIGVTWVLLMLAFEFAVGRLLFRMKWQRIFRDFDPRQGGYMAFGMLFVLVAPLLAAGLRGSLGP